MAKAALVCAALAMAAAVTLPAQNFPLQFKTIPAQDVMHFPGGYGLGMSLSPNKPFAVKKEPKAVSQHPLYGQLRSSTGGESLLVRLDESQGDGKGYDQLLVDVNQNGDLTDDAVVARVGTPEEKGSTSTTLFGPIEAAASKSIAGGRPVYYAHVTVYGRTSVGPRVAIPMTMLRLKAAWYLATTVDVDGVKRQVGIYDANSNFRLGDLPKAQIQRSSGSDSSWYFGRADVWLVDANGSGSFEEDALASEEAPFGPLLYLGAKPYKATLATDCQALEVAPWSEPLAEVALGPRADQVHNLTLAWERQGGQWQLIQPTVVGGKIQVPSGNYRLYNCNLLAKDPSGEQVAVTAIERDTRMPFSFVAGKDNKLQCGAPLEVKVSATKTRAGSDGAVFFSDSSSDSTISGAKAVRISAHVVGAEGEIYSGYYTGAKLSDQPAKPTFTIQDAAGKEVAKGNLEYG